MIRAGFGFSADALALRVADHCISIGLATRADYLANLLDMSVMERVDHILYLLSGSMRFADEVRLSPFAIEQLPAHDQSITQTQVPVLKWAGQLVAVLAGAVTSYMADSPTTVYATAPGYPIGARTVTKLRARASANALATDLVLVVQKSGVDSALTVTIPAGSTSVVTDLTHSVTAGATDTIDIKLTNTDGGTAAVASVVATVEVSA